MSDQQRADSLGCHGNTFVHTPNLDRLAFEGASFNEAFTPYPVCTPARTTMWTGVLPHRHGVLLNVYGSENIPNSVLANPNDPLTATGVADALTEMSNYQETVFSSLSAAGYATGYFGKWHLGDADPGLFDVWRGFNSQGGHWQNGVQDGTYMPDVQTDQMIDYMTATVSEGRPFLAVNGFYPPHDPYTAPKRFYEPYRGKGVPFAGYYAAVSALDHNVGRIVRSLEELGVRENTLILYFADHGESFNYRSGAGHKFNCYDDAIRVPMVLSWPGRIESPSTPDCLAGLEDLMPTVLDAVGLPSPDHLDGRSLLPWIDGDSPAWRTSYVVQNRHRLQAHEERCIRTKRWKLILSENGDHALFDLENDPEEELDIYMTPRSDAHNRFGHLPPYTATIVELAQELKRFGETSDDQVSVDLARMAIAEARSRVDIQDSHP